MDNAVKWALRRRRASDIVLFSDGSIEHVDWSTIRRWQEEFQRDYCRACQHFNQLRDARDDCAFHWTDIVGQCWNFDVSRAA